jgi:hypothetical protein
MKYRMDAGGPMPVFVEYLRHTEARVPAWRNMSRIAARRGMQKTHSNCAIRLCFN